MKFKTLTLALALLIAGGAQAAVHETPQPEAPAVVGKAQASKATKKHKPANKQGKKHAKSRKKGAKKHGKTAAHASAPHSH